MAKLREPHQAPGGRLFLIRGVARRSRTESLRLAMKSGVCVLLPCYLGEFFFQLCGERGLPTTRSVCSLLCTFLVTVGLEAAFRRLVVRTRDGVTRTCGEVVHGLAHCRKSRRPFGWSHRESNWCSEVERWCGVTTRWEMSGVCRRVEQQCSALTGRHCSDLGDAYCLRACG